MRITKIRIVAHDIHNYLDNLFDAKNGKGTIPNSESIQYFGYTLYMHPKEFLELAAPGVQHPKFYEDCIKQGITMGYPFLTVQLDKYSDKPQWKITGHEGRNRCQAVLNLFGNNDYVPVHIFPEAMRNRHLTPELLALPIVAEKGNTVHSFPSSRIDRESKRVNLGRLAETSAPSSTSEMLQNPHTPTFRKKVQRNDDDIQEVLQDESQPMHVYKNYSPAPSGTQLMHRVN